MQMKTDFSNARFINKDNCEIYRWIERNGNYDSDLRGEKMDTSKNSEA